MGEPTEGTPKAKGNLEDHPFLAGIGTGFGAAAFLCILLGGAYLHIDSRYHDNLNRQVSEYREYRDKYTEGVKAQEQLSSLRGRLEELQEKHAALLDANWEQECGAERIRNASMQERLALEEERSAATIRRLQDELDELRRERNDLELRLSSLPIAQQKAVGEGLEAFDGLLAEKRKLLEENSDLKRDLERRAGELERARSQLLAYKSELTRLRVLVRTGSRGDKQSNVASKAEIDMVVATVQGTSLDVEAARTVLQQVNALGKKLTGEDLVRILQAADVSLDAVEGQLIASLSDRLVYPLSPSAMKSIIGSISLDVVRRQVTGALAEAQARHTEGE